MDNPHFSQPALLLGFRLILQVVLIFLQEWQCATIQLDFQLPVNFGLEYVTAERATASKEDAAAEKPAESKVENKAEMQDNQTAADAGDLKDGAKKPSVKPLTPGCARPVIIHRAMAGSIERFTGKFVQIFDSLLFISCPPVLIRWSGILIEHFGGKWPLWLSPRQIQIIPVGRGFFDYASEVQKMFREAGFWVDVDLSGETLQKKVRRAQLSQYNFVFGECSQLVSFYLLNGASR